MLNRLKKSISYRIAKSYWHKLAIHHAYQGYSGKTVFLEKLNLTLNEDCHIQLLKGLNHANAIADYGGKFMIEDDILNLQIDNILLEIQTAEDLFIVREIYVNNCYDFHLNGTCTLIDIGMNVGMASLFFAQKENVRKIYAYEPFKPTYLQAQNNFDKNGNLGSKIEPKNIGLGKREEVISVEYSPENRGRVGLEGNKLIKDEISDLTHEQLVIESAASVFKEISEKSTDALVVKMDCEGAEFDIIANLKEHKLLESISIIMMEWHDKDPTPIINSLTESGLCLFRINYSKKVGMIYGVR